MDETQKTTKEYKKFMDYYNSSEEYREKHKKYMTEKTECPLCGFRTCRSNLTRHKRSRNCKKRIEQIASTDEKKEILKTINELLEKVKNM